MSTHKIPAIPTTYRGVTFRSRLESRYAILWDLLGIPWQYEPLELEGYIPDFLLQAEVFSQPQVAGPVLVEVRPVVHVDGFREPIAKIAKSGWRGPAMVVGATLFPRVTPWGPETPIGRGHAAVSPDHARDDAHEWYPIGWFAALRQFGMGGEDITRAWNEAGNRNQWWPARP